MIDFRPENPAPGRKFHEESEFEVKNSKIHGPEGKTSGKNNLRKLMFEFVFVFFLFLTYVRRVINRGAY